MVSDTMTADALALEAKMHKVLAIASAFRAALARANAHLYLPFGLARLAWCTHRLRVFVEIAKPEPCTDEEVRQIREQSAVVLGHIRELQKINVAVVSTLRKNLPHVLLSAYRPFVESLERNNTRLGDILDELEMEMDPRLEAAIHKAIGNLGPEVDSDWRASLESMRH